MILPKKRFHKSKYMKILFKNPFFHTKINKPQSNPNQIISTRQIEPC